MNIGIVYPSLRSVGGAENVVMWLAESLAQRGHHVVLFTREISDTAWGAPDRRPFTVHLLDIKKRRSTLRTNREAGRALTQAVNGHLLDIVNPHNYPASLWVHYAKGNSDRFPKTVLFLHNLTRNFYSGVIDVHFNRLGGIRNVWNRFRPKKLLRNARQLLFGYRKLDQAAVRSCDKVLANSAYTANLAAKIYGVPVNACPLGVSLDRYRMAASTGMGVATGTGDLPVVLVVARIEIQKNFDTLLRAIRTLRERSSARPFKVRIAGGGPQLRYYQKKSAKMGLGNCVEFLGSVPSNEIGTVYASADFLVHIPLDEPFGLVPVEAALFRKPSIVSDHGGPAEIVQDRVTGLHVDALDHLKLADSIEKLLDHPELVQRMGEAAHARVSQDMTWESFVDRYETFLRGTTAGSSANG